MRRQTRALTDDEKSALAVCIPPQDLESATICEGHVPWYLPARFAAVTRGNCIFLRPGTCRTNSVEGLALLAHELAHVGQYRRGATWLTFLLSYLRHGYRRSPLEIEAREAAGRLRRTLTRSAAAAVPRRGDPG